MLKNYSLLLVKIIKYDIYKMQTLISVQVVWNDSIIFGPRC
jgi:hypothetical protein